MSAKECAGLIHSSIKQKFSWVEIYNFDDWKRWNEQNNQAKDFFTLSGKVTKQNADYLVKDGDICYFL
jgi:ribosome-binding ATPase YchF (GTP1/OBG family)